MLSVRPLSGGRKAERPEFWDQLIKLVTLSWIKGRPSETDDWKAVVTWPSFCDMTVQSWYWPSTVPEGNNFPSSPAVCGADLSKAFIKTEPSA